MIGRRELLLLIAWVGLVSAVSWIAQTAMPAADDTVVVRVVGSTDGQPPQWQPAVDSEHSPLLPRLVSLPAGDAGVVFLQQAQAKTLALRLSANPLVQTLQQQRVRWQI